MSEQAVEQDRAKRKSAPYAKTVEDLGEEALLCRDLRHAWRFVTDYTLHRRKGKEPSLVDRHIVCTRCNTERFDTYLMPTFERVSTRYVYPSDVPYRVYGVGRLEVGNVRAEFFRRQKNVRAVS